MLTLTSSAHIQSTSLLMETDHFEIQSPVHIYSMFLFEVSYTNTTLWSTFHSYNHPANSSLGLRLP